MKFFELIKRAELEDKKNINNVPTEEFKKFEQEILNSNDFDDIIHFASQNFKSTNKKALEDKIIQKGDVFYNYKLATVVKNIDVLPHQEMVMKKGWPTLMLNFAMDVKGANVKAIEKRILEVFNPQKDFNILLRLALIDGVDVKPIGEIIANSDIEGCFDLKGKAYHLLVPDAIELAKQYQESDERLNFLIRNFIFASLVKNVDTKLHQDIIMLFGDIYPEMCYLFAKNVNGADIKALETKFLSYNSDGKYNFNTVKYNNYAKFAYKFARDVKGADIKAHENIVLKTEDANISLDFVKNIKGADLKAHGKIIKASGDKKLINEYKQFALKTLYRRLFNKNKKTQQNLEQEEMNK